MQQFKRVSEACSSAVFGDSKYWQHVKYSAWSVNSLLLSGRISAQQSKTLVLVSFFISVSQELIQWLWQHYGSQLCHSK